MKANELRVGNWIKEFDKPFQVETININREMYDVNPIELTKEWLLKFGFEKYKNDWYDDFNGEDEPYNFILLDASGDYYYRDNKWQDVRIKYVHELQNLYAALNNEELKLNESKEANTETRDSTVK